MAPANSIRSLFAYASTLFSQVPLQNPDFSGPTGDVQAGDGSASAPFTPVGVTPYEPLSGAPSCPIDGPMSCHNQTQTDSCCFIYPGGRLLLTQFWDDTVHVGGSDQDWTLHGLWPDLCDGSYDQYCGMTPRFNNITDTLKQYNQTGLLENMERYWVASYGTNEHLWAHEYNKHASCINTLAPACYGDNYTPGLEVVDYFERAFGLFRMLDTYHALAQAGIEPDYSKTYDLDRIQDVLSAFSGGRVILKCGGRHHNVLHEAWYVYFVQGSLQSGQFVPAQDSFKGDHGSCAKQVRYLPKRQKKHSLPAW